jgi:hypothetical protein
MFPDLDAIIQFNNFVFDLKKQVANGDVINWNGVGEIKKGMMVRSDSMRLNPAHLNNPFPR